MSESASFTIESLNQQILDFDTLAKSGPLPINFLRGCGLPNSLITYLPSLLNRV
jgi:hypothetical protein